MEGTNLRSRAADRYSNLTIKKIPKTVLSRCECGHDDDSLKIESLPGVILDYDNDGKIVGIEILNASKREQHPKSVKYAVAQSVSPNW